MTIRVLGRDDGEVLNRVAAGVFDDAVQSQLRDEFLNDPRHHLAVAIDGDVVVGMASGVHYVHPDKRPELWINEVGVAPTHRNRRLGRQLLAALLQRAREVGCIEAWVLTDRTNEPAMRMYTASGGRVAARDQVMFTFPLGS